MEPSDNVSQVSELQPRLRLALELARPAMEALAKNELLTINIAPLDVVARVGGALPKLLPLKARIAAELTSFDSSQFDRLELYSLALLQAQTLCNATSGPPPQLSALSDEASQLRFIFLSDLRALVNRKQIQASCLARLKHNKGHRNVASDILVAATIFRNHWTTICNCTGVSEAELARAEFLGTEILRLVHGRHRRAEIVVKATLDRARAYTLLVRTYNEVRKAVLFVMRTQPDVEKLAPSLYGKRRRTKNATAAAEADSAAQDVVTAGEAAPVGIPPAALSACTALPTMVVKPEPTVEGSPRIPVGLPGSDPFIH